MNEHDRTGQRSREINRKSTTRTPFLGTAERLEIRDLLAVLGPWTTLDAMPPRRDDRTAYIQPSAALPLTIDQGMLTELLRNAPMEFTAAAAAPLEFHLPMPDGSFDRFAVLEAPIMEPGLAAKFPDMKTYRGQGIDDPAATIRFDVTPLGFHAQVLSPEGAVYVDPYYHLDTSLYISYHKRDLTRTQAWQEFEDHEDHGDEVQKTTTAIAAPVDFVGPRSSNESIGSDARFVGAGGEGPVLLKSGTQLRTYRTAVAATGEYTAFFGGTVAQGQAAIVVAMNRINQVYENELSIRMTLVANNNLLVYTNAATDPYTNSNGTAMLSQNQTNVDAVIGNANYDIGHVFSTGGGGIAALSSVGVNSQKAYGVTGQFSPVGDPFYIDYVAHEMGHQYGGTHTFNTPNAGSNRTASTAYEPGSGSTIQAYAGITGADDLQSNSDPYFHFISLEQIINHVDVVIPSVGTRTATGNVVPTISAGLSSYVIPTGTPF
ncbi:MAG: zinc-dependent metalloprotease family protein, partial [Isosphaeraceae bacterium]